MKRISQNSVTILYPYCGLDEAGRGALAGPLVSAGVVLTHETENIIRNSTLKIKDGKLLLPHERVRVYEFIKQLPLIIKTVVISARQINNRGIAYANRESFRILIRSLQAEQYIVDGNMRIGRIRNKSKKIISIVDADATILAAVLAGIVAKVERDALMNRLHSSYPEYVWNKNAGYGTKEHLSALRTLGHTRYHRNIFITTALKKLI